tara:strand:- start:366 stop:620 length:255 start_codon:yes stop_codon:yes gene_type:complete
MHSTHCPGWFKVDPADLRVGNRTTDKDRLEHPRKVDIRDVPGPTSEKAQILLTLHRGTDVTGPHVIDKPFHDIQSSLADSARLA